MKTPGRRAEAEKPSAYQPPSERRLAGARWMLPTELLRGVLYRLILPTSPPAAPGALGRFEQELREVHSAPADFEPREVR